MNPDLVARRELVAVIRAASVALKSDSVYGGSIARAILEPYSCLRPLMDRVVDVKVKEIDFPTVRSYLAQDKKIAAIKEYRLLTGVGLKQAKDEVDRMQAEMA